MANLGRTVRNVRWVSLTVLALSVPFACLLDPRPAAGNIDVPQEAVVLAIDEDSIGNGKPYDNPPSFFSDVDVNDRIAKIGLRAQLPFFAANACTQLPCRIIALRTGQVGDEAWFALTTIPARWNAAGPSGDGLRNYIEAGPGLGTPNANGKREALLDKVPNVTPLRATGLRMLVNRHVCAVVYDSDISVNYGPLNGSLKGANLGKVAFHVHAVKPPPAGSSSSSLPEVEIYILDAERVCSGPLLPFTEAPTPTSSSEPFDIW